MQPDTVWVAYQEDWMDAENSGVISLHYSPEGAKSACRESTFYDEEEGYPKPTLKWEELEEGTFTAEYSEVKFTVSRWSILP